MIDVRLYGRRAKGFKEALAVFPTFVNKSLDTIQKRIVRRYANRVQRNILKESFSLAPKQYTGHDPRPLVHSTALVNAITFWKSKDGYVAGIERWKRNEKGVNIGKYARAHELGIRVPKRPVWALTLERDFKGKQGINAEITTHLKKDFKKLEPWGFFVEW